jgi:hypothetical protein
MAASDKEIEEVADAACIHDPITTRFPKVRCGTVRLIQHHQGATLAACQRGASSRFH